MSEHHTLTITKTHYPGGLKVIECTKCDYAFAAEVSRHETIDLGTKVTINYGDLYANHTLFQAPEEMPTLSISAELG